MPATRNASSPANPESAENSIEKASVVGAVIGATVGADHAPAMGAKPVIAPKPAPSWLGDIATKARKLGVNARITPYSSGGRKYWRYREFINGKPKLDHIGPDRPVRSKGGITDEQRREYKKQVEARRARKRRRIKG